MILRSPSGSIALWRSRCRRSLRRSVFRFDRLVAFRLRRLVRPWCAQLEVACRPFAELAGEIERRFLAFGEALQEQVKLTARLNAQSRQLNEFGARSDRGESAVHRVMLRMTTHLNLSDDFAREADRLAGTLEQHAHHLQQLLQDQQRLERSFAPMRALHAFFRIESATLPPELQSLFHAVTTEMRRLHDEVSASFAGHTTALIETRRHVLAAAGHLRTQAAEHLATTAAKRLEVQQSLADLDAKLAQGRRRNAQLGAAIAVLDRETDQITVSLQYQDITRQKMDHVREAAHTVLAGFAPGDRTPLRPRVRLQRMLCQVQVVQLDSLQDELEHATTAITSGLRGLLDQLDGIERDAISLTGLNEITADMDSAITTLGDIHRVTAELMRSSLARLTEATQTARGFADATIGATGTMRQISADLLMMGLNAQVQALQAKNGCLEVLASAVSQISSEAGALTLEFERKLASTTETLTRFVASSEAFHAQVQAEHQALATEDDLAFAALTTEHAAHRALVQEVGASLRQLKQQADDLLASIALAEISREPIAHLREVFTALAQACTEATEDDQPLDDTQLADVHSRYTMDSERAAHAAALARSKPAVAAPATPATPAPASVGAVAQPVAATPDPSPSLGDNVELF